jgi:hypothetical protein
MTTSRNALELTGQAGKLTWLTLVAQLREKFLVAILTAAISVLATGGVLYLLNPTMSPVIRIVGNVGIPIACEILLGLFLFYRSDYIGMRTQLSSFRRIAHQRDLDATEIQQKHEQVTGQITLIKDYLDIKDVGELSTLLPTVQDASIQSLRREGLRATVTLSKLLQEGKVTATYEDQLTFAEVFANQTQSYFRATCLDKPSEFEGRNFYYLDDLDKLPGRLRPVSGSSVSSLPVIGRIFIGEARDLAGDFESESIRILDLYERHLRWGRALGMDSAIRFLTIPHNQYLAFFHRADVDPAHIIEDFMVVDDRFVYGRRQGFQGQRVELGYLDDSNAVTRYNALYGSLWRAARTIEQVLQSLKAEHPGLETALEVFREHCEKRGSKLDIMRDYEHDFGEYERSGTPFFDRVCQRIAAGSGYCFAVDRADKKEGSLWKIWQESPYREFREASKQAAITAAVFQRLFILQNWPKQEERTLVEGLIRDFACSNLHIGFLLVSKAGLEELTEKFDTDFIVVGVDAGCTHPENGFGFELQQEKFSVDQLQWIRNLIAKSQLERHTRIFNSLWNKPETIKITSSDHSEIIQKTELLIQEGVKQNAATT